MKIVSKFKDYYDVTQGLGYDESLVYVRKNTINKVETYRKSDGSWANRIVDQEGNPSPEAAVDLMQQRHYIPGQSVPICADYPGLSLSYGKIILAGKAYPFMVKAWVSPTRLGELAPTKYNLQDIGNRADVWDFLYTQEECLAVLEDIKARQDKKKVVSGRIVRAPEDKVAAMFSDTTDYTEWAVKHSIPVAAISENSGIRKHNFGARRPLPLDSREFQLNPCLRDFEFHRCKPAHEVSQEIAMFLGNIAAPDKCPVTLSEKDRVQQHGFDNMSFRKSPTPKGRKKRPK